MDFAYFNGVLRSTIFPPIDPWYAGGYINYYYFGYVIVGTPVLLLKMVPAIRLQPDPADAVRADRDGGVLGGVHAGQYAARPR